MSNEKEIPVDATGRRSASNPLGAEGPMVSFNIPLWQVGAALLLVACMLTAYKLVERKYIAPHRPVAWEEFSIERARQLRRSRRDFLVLVPPLDRQNAERIEELFRDLSVQKMIFVARITTIRATRSDHDLTRWLARQFSDPPVDGLVVVSGLPNVRPQAITAENINMARVIEMLDSLN